MIISSDSQIRAQRAFSYNPQDSVVMEPGQTQLDSVQLGAAAKPDLNTDKFKLVGGLAPNSEGQFVFPQTEPGFHRANAFASVVKTLADFEKAYGQPVQWATGNQRLSLSADGGEMLNAYYSRRDGGLFFFHSTDPVNGKVVYGADSGEVSSHECGHAILDAVRPKYMGSWSPDPGAFHESFGDVIALFRSLQEPAVVDKVLAQTAGDLSKPNMAAALGEEMGIIINHTSGKNSTGGDYTRNALNDFVWQDPSTLPKNAPPDQLSREPHSFSRVWTGAVYDILEALVKDRLAQPNPPDIKTALRESAVEGMELYGRLMRKAPKAGFAFRQMANAFVQSDLELNGGRRAGMIREALEGRQLLAADTREIERVPEGSQMAEVVLQGDRFGAFAGAKVQEETSGDAPLDFREAGNQLSERMADLIQDGEILLTQPGQQLSLRNLIKPDGEPYSGYVSWDNQEKRIVRNTIVS
ncbi:hypothetical protein IV102_16565 [bacterium]|nr:hypothetical protein [bacterium]